MSLSITIACCLLIFFYFCGRETWFIFGLALPRDFVRYSF